MCFDYDYDWFPSVVDLDKAAVHDKAARCDECRLPIPVGAVHVHLWMQERDPTEEDEPEEGEEFDPGETYEGRWCRCAGVDQGAAEDWQEHAWRSADCYSGSVDRHRRGRAARLAADDQAAWE